uniref:Uncharacterized protein n=1 Tax=Onchocerca volvulus TaxID=6282 RepID=A0A8R1XM76_ONCVO
MYFLIMCTFTAAIVSKENIRTSKLLSKVVKCQLRIQHAFVSSADNDSCMRFAFISSLATNEWIME